MFFVNFLLLDLTYCLGVSIVDFKKFRLGSNLANIYMLKGNNRNTRMALPGVFVVNFEHFSHLFLVFLLLTWNKKMLVGSLGNFLMKCYFLYLADSL